MKSVILMLMTIALYGCATKTPTESDKAYLKAHAKWEAQQKLLTSEEFEQTNGYLEQIEELYAKADTCANKNVDIVLSLDEEGKVFQSWTNIDVETNQCFLKLAKQLEFTPPPMAPLYFAVKMEIDAYKNPFPHVFGQYN
ncbi:MAG: hypothetical protein ABJV04_11380 [Aliiglaciecola sp.]|uniref:hypothetical protein n=1 Tax=Aliiglaciecola sp. TaxID=1872441 RepID=UPI00329A705C